MPTLILLPYPKNPAMTKHPFHLFKPLAALPLLLTCNATLAGEVTVYAAASLLCTGQTESVPVGIYAKEALVKLGWWDAIKGRVVGTDDVRAALDLAGRGECIGIVYATDARISNKVETVARFPDGLHAPIIYPAALVTQSGEAKAFFDYLQSSGKLFAGYGFKLLK